MKFGIAMTDFLGVGGKVPVSLLLLLLQDVVMLGVVPGTVAAGS